MNALILALKFHEIYERLAPQFGYETRTETRQFDPNSPNGKLMIAVCGEILRLAVDDFEIAATIAAKSLCDLREAWDNLPQELKRGADAKG